MTFSRPHILGILVVLAFALSNFSAFAQNDGPLQKADVMPLWEGCENEDPAKALQCTKAEIAHFVRENLACPIFPTSEWYDSTSHIYFEVDPEGNVQNVKVLKPGDEQLDAAAIEAVEQLPAFIPGSHQGEPCAVKFSIPVRSEAKCIRKRK